ncbi:MAG TPA: dephospho-CoA kinase, partial [Candidatus Korarchaeota archaeon]|nr:dephospho-CoA kinase [Candidatus Korarchaeota archaeon]
MNDLNVYIVGFMGSGKSTVGRLLAERMGMEFIDTDELIEKKTEISIEELFKRFGEDFFREIEARILFEVSKTLGVVVACGGGVVLRDEN